MTFWQGEAMYSVRAIQTQAKVKRLLPWLQINNWQVLWATPMMHKSPRVSLSSKRTEKVNQ